MTEIKVGMMALATIVAVIYMSLKITSRQSGFGEYVSYRTILQDASGIFPKTPIKIAGINAGKIQSIDLQGNTALVTFEVLKRVMITEGSKLKVRTVGFLGDKFLEIIIAEGDTAAKEMSLIEFEYAAGLDTIARDASDILKDVKVIVESVKETLVPKDEGPPLKRIMSDVKAIMSNTKKITEDLKRIVGDNEKNLNELFANLRQFSDDLRYHMDMREKESLTADLKRILANADKITQDMNALITDMRSGKGTIGKLLVEDTIADEVQETIAGVKKIVSKVDAIRTELSAFTGYNSEYGGESEAALKIFPSPERFYLLGLTTSKFGVAKEKETTTTVNGAETVEYRKEVQRNVYRFSVQVGRKLQNWVFRGGLIQSTGGLGVDWEYSDLGLVLSGEVFDYRKNIGFNLKLSSDLHLWNVFYARAALEDALNGPTRGYSLGVGLRFQDEDLKGLLGFFL